MRLAPVIAAVVLLALGAAGPASAASVSTREENFYSPHDGDYPVSILRIAADPGETNDMNVQAVVRSAPPGLLVTVTVVDRGAPLRAGGDCRAVSEHDRRARRSGSPATG